MKRLIQKTANALGYEVRRNSVAPPPSSVFQPYVEHFSIAGVAFDVWIGDPTGKEWYTPEQHTHLAEHTETARLVHPGDRVLEIGAHHGFTAMLLSKLVGEQGFVLSVEPSPFNAMMATAQIGLNRAANCRVLQAAASDRKGRSRISRDSNAMVTDSADGIEVAALTVDEIDSMSGPFNVLKIDVEGFERQVLAGAAGLLQREPAILLELHSPFLHLFGSTPESVLHFLGASYAGTFVPRDARDQVHAFAAETLPRDVIVNLFLT
jgi:FkbM family methyltransferase